MEIGYPLESEREIPLSDSKLISLPKGTFIKAVFPIFLG